MASFKNQHFVPRCYLRPFTINSANKAINLLNIDRMLFINSAPVKSQCSKNYFYGEDLKVEKALQNMETAYASILIEINSPGYYLMDDDKMFLRQFWLLQHLRTEAASKRNIEMIELMNDVIDKNIYDFKIEMRKAVYFSINALATHNHVVNDLKICLLKNKTKTPFITSDNPAILTNRWFLSDKRCHGTSFGTSTAGTIIILPLTPNILCLGYDGDVYNVTHKKGWVDIKNESDINAFNQHQYLNCRTNIYVHDNIYKESIIKSFIAIKSLRPKAKHRLIYAVLDQDDGQSKTYKVIDIKDKANHQEALVVTESINVKPNAWPKQIKWRKKGAVFTNGTGVGYVRRVYAESANQNTFRKEYSHK